MTAFERIIKIAKKKTRLEIEIEKTINETKLGYSRRESLERFSARTGVQDIRSFVGLIIQSDELGTSLVDLLRNFSADLRFRRLNKAEKLAAQASTKMLIPLFIFIFPVVFILMLSPMLSGMFSSGTMPF
jgi:tight adherence protein C